MDELVEDPGLARPMPVRGGPVEGDPSATCPYCAAFLGRRPRKKTVCPSCDRTIWVRVGIDECLHLVRDVDLAVYAAARRHTLKARAAEEAARAAEEAARAAEEGAKAKAKAKLVGRFWRECERNRRRLFEAIDRVLRGKELGLDRRDYRTVHRRRGTRPGRAVTARDVLLVNAGPDDHLVDLRSVFAIPRAISYDLVWWEAKDTRWTLTVDCFWRDLRLSTGDDLVWRGTSTFHLPKDLRSIVEDALSAADAWLDDVCARIRDGGVPYGVGIDNVGFASRNATRDYMRARLRDRIETTECAAADRLFGRRAERINPLNWSRWGL